MKPPGTKLMCFDGGERKSSSFACMPASHIDHERGTIPAILIYTDFVPAR
jgi:hypothetical protein